MTQKSSLQHLYSVLKNILLSLLRGLLLCLFACVGTWGFGDERLTRISKFFQVCWMDEAKLQSQIAAKLQPGWGTKGARHLANSPS